MLQSMGWQRDGHDLVTEQQQQITLHSTHTEECPYILCPLTSVLRTIWNMMWKLHFILSLHYLYIWRGENRMGHHRKRKIIKSHGIECVLKNGKSQSHIVYDMTHKLYSDSKLLLLLLSRFSHVRLCDPIDSSPPGSPVPGILQARTLQWAAISFPNAWKVKVKSLSRVRLYATP